jgi:hypothetical protein
MFLVSNEIHKVYQILLTSKTVQSLWGMGDWLGMERPESENVRCKKWQAERKYNFYLYIFKFIHTFFPSATPRRPNNGFVPWWQPFIEIDGKGKNVLFVPIRREKSYGTVPVLKVWFVILAYNNSRKRTLIIFRRVGGGRRGFRL